MPKAILITGANGQLGSELRQLAAAYPHYQFVPVGREQLDIGERQQLIDFCRQRDWHALINCAAYTAVDRAESEQQQAERINCDAVRYLAEIARERDIPLLHISTDYVFAGDQHRPYVETDATGPRSVYGASKWQGEQAMLAINPARSAIIRTSWVYSAFGNNFVKTMLRLGREREHLNVVFDQIGTPTYARDLAQAILQLLPQLDRPHTEIYHYSNEGVCSWYDFAKAIFALSGLSCRVSPIETREYPTPATRPHYSLLNKHKIKADFALTIPYWRDSLQDCLNALENQYA